MKRARPGFIRDLTLYALEPESQCWQIKTELLAHYGREAMPLRAVQMYKPTTPGYAFAYRLIFDSGIELKEETVELAESFIAARLDSLGQRHAKFEITFDQLPRSAAIRTGSGGPSLSA